MWFIILSFNRCFIDLLDEILDSLEINKPPRWAPSRINVGTPAALAPPILLTIVNASSFKHKYVYMSVLNISSLLGGQFKALSGVFRGPPKSHRGPQQTFSSLTSVNPQMNHENLTIGCFVSPQKTSLPTLYQGRQPVKRNKSLVSIRRSRLDFSPFQRLQSTEI